MEKIGTNGRTGMSSHIQTQAREWLFRLNEGPFDEATKKEFQVWLRAAPAHEHAFRKSFSAWEMLGGTDAAVDQVQRLLDGVPEPAPKGGPLAWWQNPYRAGGAVAAALGIAWGISFWMSSPAPVSLTSAVGEVHRHVLEDGTVVTLGPMSEMQVKLTAQGREVILQRGRVFFDVAHDEARPFTVRAGDTEVRVLGTAFDMRRGQSTVRIAVSKGRVEVADLPPEQGRPDDEVRVLTGGEQVVAGRGGSLSDTKEADLAMTTGWITGHLVYDTAPLAEIVADLNAFRQEKIVVIDPELNELSITAAFSVDQAEQVLLAIAESHEIRMTRSGDRTRLTR